MTACTLDQARAAKPRALAILSRLASVVGIGVTRVGRGYGLKINLERAPRAALPTEVDGVPLRVHVAGRITRRRRSD